MTSRQGSYYAAQPSHSLLPGGHPPAMGFSGTCGSPRRANFSLRSLCLISRAMAPDHQFRIDVAISTFARLDTRRWVYAHRHRRYRVSGRSLGGSISSIRCFSTPPQMVCFGWWRPDSFSTWMNRLRIGHADTAVICEAVSGNHVAAASRGSSCWSGARISLDHGIWHRPHYGTELPGTPRRSCSRD